MKRILIVDNKLDVLTGLSSILYEFCHFDGDIRTVVNGREALYEASHCSYDTCFLDTSLTDINVIDVMKDIHQISPATVLVLMNAGCLLSNMEDILQKSDLFYVDKPFDLPQIKQVMNMAMENKENTMKNDDNGDHEETRGKRQHKRRPLSRIINFHVKEFKLMEFKGGIIDVSCSGVGIQTYYPLKRGLMVSFNHSLDNKEGVVAWSMYKSENNYRAGIKFI